MTDEIRDLKTKAKNRRDLARYSSAVRLTESAIALSRDASEATKAQTYRSQLASELVDIYGLLGGIQRRWGLDSAEARERSEHFQASVDAYDLGYVFESDPTYGLANSYNLLSRLVGRVLLDPSLLSVAVEAPSNGAASGLNVRAELERAEKIIERQLVTERALHHERAHSIRGACI
jgi:hypothetical protein